MVRAGCNCAFPRREGTNCILNGVALATKLQLRGKKNFRHDIGLHLICLLEITGEDSKRMRSIRAEVGRVRCMLEVLFLRKKGKYYMGDSQVSD